MSDLQPPPRPPPPLQQRSGCATALMVIFGVILLLPGLAGSPRLLHPMRNYLRRELTRMGVTKPMRFDPGANAGS